ncbi:MAG: NAD(P)H-binding protein [Streptosporangiaceae bacterium]|jgi:nucleoside-diphosphate-sugar epimerase
MRVVIAGGHGKIALLLERLLADRGDSVAGLIRDPGQSADLVEAGAEPIVLDLEHATADQVAGAVRGADAVVFAAGAGPGSGAGRKETMDLGGAVLLADGAERAGVRRYVMVSSIGAESRSADDSLDPVFRAYLRAKAAADANVLPRAALRTTIVRPGGLTNEPGTAMVAIGDSVGHGSIPRADVAAVLLAVLDTPGTAGQKFELISGGTPVAEAVARRAG